MRTVLLIPVYNSEMIIDDFLRNLRSLDPQPDKYVFLENNSYDDTFSRVWKADLPAPHEVLKVHFVKDAVRRCKNRYDLIAHVRQLLLTRARRLNPDFAVFLDDDLLVKTPDMITKLTSWGFDIVAAPFKRWFPSGLFLAAKWKAEEEGQFLLYPNVRKKLDTPFMTSAGCMCLSRKVLQDRRLDFYPIAPTEYDHIALAAEDFGFCVHARELGYEIYLDGTVVLEHYIALLTRLVKPWTQGTEESFRYRE